METPEIQITSLETPVVPTSETPLIPQEKEFQAQETVIVSNFLPEENLENSEVLVLEEPIAPEGVQVDTISEDDTETSLEENEEKITPEDKLIQAMNEFGEKVDGLKEAIHEFSQTMEEKPKNFEGFNEIFNVLLIRLQALKQEYEYKKIEKGEDHPETQALKQKIEGVQYMVGMIIGFIMGQALSY